MQIYGAFKLSSTKPDVGWVGAYSHFLPNREIFKPYSVQTVLFTKMFRSGFVQHLGNGNRYCKLSHVENVNDSFLKFVREYKINFEPSHRQAFRNLEAGYKSAAKYDRPQPDYDKNAFGLACSFLRKHFGPFVAGARVLGEETVILDLDRSTAAGYPWNMVFHTKGEMLDAGFLQPIQWYWMLIGAIAYQIPIALRYNQQYHPIWTNTEKREIREIIKIIEDKIRTFTASPIEFTVAANRMCLDFNNMFYEAASSCSFVGRSKFMQGWHRLYMRLGKYQTGFEFDASSWDASVFRDALWDQMAFRWESYMSEYQTPENRRRLTHIYGEIVNSVIILESEKGVADIIMKNTGNPSGSANTIVDNTMVLYRVFAYCWIRLCPKEMLDKGYLAFNDNVCMILNGDDNTMTVSPEALAFFNAPNIIRMANELGVVLTTPSEVPRHVLDLSFLSHQPVMETGFSGAWILPAPYYNRVLSSLAYGSEVDDVRWHLLRAAALRVDSWAHPQLRRVIMDYIKYVLRRYKSQLYGTILNVKIEDIFNMIQTDEWCFALYTGLESGVGTVKQIPHKINFAMSLVRSEGIADLSLVARSFNPPPQGREISVLPISPGTIGQPIKILVQRKRKRTGNPEQDGLTGVERNPGPDYGEGLSAYIPDVVQSAAMGMLKNQFTSDGIVSRNAIDSFAHYNSKYNILERAADFDEWWNGNPHRERTGNPYNDGLVGVESNPGPNKNKKVNKLKKKVEKAVERKVAKRIGKAPKRRTRVKRSAVTSTAPVYAGAYSIGASMNRNLYSTGKPDNLMADCVKIGGINVKGSCFSNLGVGTDTHASPGDYAGLFLDGAPHTTAFIAFNFEDFDDRIRNLAETYQYYRVRFLRPRFIPMVGTTVTGQWAFSISDNVEVASTTTPTTLNSLLTSNVSGAGTAWVQRELPPYIYNSAKVWSTVLSAGGTDINNVISEQLLFTARVLIPSAAGGPLEYGRIQFDYSIDFFEPRGNVGTVTLDKPSPSFLNSILTYNDRRDIRFGRSKLIDVLINRLNLLLNDYSTKHARDESKECDSPFVMEQNPMTQSIHIPKNVVERLAQSLTGDAIRRV